MIERRVGHLPVLVGFELDKIEISTPLEDAIKNNLGFVKFFEDQAFHYLPIPGKARPRKL